MTVRYIGPKDYSEYLRRQAEKAALPETLEKLLPKRAERVAWFRDRFATRSIPVGGSGSALCLGARYGEEVEALQLLGWKATGIDIAPHPPWVVAGDMNQPLPEPRSREMIYTNAFDHCWNPLEFVRNAVAAIRHCGTLFLHVASGPAGAYETVAWDALADVLTLLESSGVSVQRVASLPAFYGLDTEIVGVVQ